MLTTQWDFSIDRLFLPMHYIPFRWNQTVLTHTLGNTTQPLLDSSEPQWKELLLSPHGAFSVLATLLRSKRFFDWIIYQGGFQVDDILHDGAFPAIYCLCHPYTLTGLYNMYALYKAVEYIVDAELPGDFAECGVWRGGSSMVIAASLLHFGDTSRTIYLYDTFTGMTEPTAEDVRYDGLPAQPVFASRRKKGIAWCEADIEEVRTNMSRTGYPPERITLVPGRVEDTIPGIAAERLALLRLDTDWYDSTRHEMEHLFPRLEEAGVLIIDDYGWWRGSRTAADEYLAAHGVSMLLTRIDPTGATLGLKPGMRTFGAAGKAQ